MRTVHGHKKMNGYVSITGDLGGFRWRKRTAESTEEYKRGIKNPKRSWGKCTCEAAARYKAGVDKAHIKDRLRRGVIKAGLTKWKTRTLLKGPTRFAEGVYGAGDVYAEGYKPYHTRFPSIFMPKRYRRGDPRNIDRCKVVCAEFGRVKVGRAPTKKVTCPED